MDVRHAVEMAKKHVAETFADEPIHQIGLEEIELDPDSRVWSVTIGFAREWREPVSLMRSLTPSPRTYKVVRINDADGAIQSIKHRDILSAA